MELSGAGLLVTTATLLGLVHAFDVDHLVAVATFSSAKSGRRHGLRFCAHWAVGHGLTILLLAVLVFALGITLPDSFQKFAETMVGVALIALGVWALRSVRAQLSHNPGAVVVESESVRRKPLAIGSLHGIAGSAPILFAFLTDAQTPLIGLGLILVFIAGVFFSMLIVGLLLGSAFARLAGFGRNVMPALRSIIASLSIVIGGTMVYVNF